MKRFKKVVSLLFTAVILFGISVLPAFAAESGTCGDNLTWNFENGVLTISGEGAMYDYYSHSPSGMSPWHDLPITSIVVEEGVTSLGVSAFDYLPKRDIKSISLPASLGSIGDGALYGYHVEKISFAKGNNYFKIVDGCIIGKNGVLVRGSDTGFIPTDGSVKAIGCGAFVGYNALTEVIIPEGILSIGQAAFSGCKNLSTVILPESLGVISDYAFNGCENLVDINFPNRINWIGAYAFEDCKNLKNVEFPDGLENILEGAFTGCNSLERVTLPKNVKGFYPFGLEPNIIFNVYANSNAHKLASSCGYNFEIIGTDVDGDGVVTVSDALSVLRIASGISEEEATPLKGDVDGDGHLTVADALAILRVAAGLK